ncbi:hypothetical protein SFRURICE_000588, partial [Spodoptera frugiperda]
HWCLIGFNLVYFVLLRLSRWSSGRKCDCRTRGLGFDSRVGSSTEAGIIYGNRVTPYYTGLTQSLSTHNSLPE